MCTYVLPGWPPARSVPTDTRLPPARRRRPGGAVRPGAPGGDGQGRQGGRQAGGEVRLRAALPLQDVTAHLGSAGECEGEQQQWQPQQQLQ